MNQNELLEKALNVSPRDFRYRLRTEDIVRLRKKYWESSFLVEHFLGECRSLGLVPELVLSTLLDGSIHSNGFSALSPVLLRAFPGNDQTASFELSDISPETFPGVIWRSHDGCVFHRAKIRWTGMNARCIFPTCSAYPNYGGRGIKVCDAWHHLNPNGRRNYCNWFDEQMFREELTTCKGYQVDRISNDGHYEPLNCRLVKSQINSQNTRSTRLNAEEVCSLRDQIRAVELKDRTRHLAVLSDINKVSYQNLHNAVTGATWGNVDKLSEPVTVGKSTSVNASSTCTEESNQ